MIAETILATTLLTSNQLHNIEQHFPTNEIPIILEVAQEYELNQTETLLLFSIRRIENSGMLRINEFGEYEKGNANGMQFGVGDGKPEHPARRYAGDFEKSLRVQAQWAAGSLKKRYRKKGLKCFAGRWCKENKENWQYMAINWYSKLNRRKLNV